MRSELRTERSRQFASAVEGEAKQVIDAKGNLVTESFVNGHLHLCKVYTLEMAGQAALKEYNDNNMGGAMTSIERAADFKACYDEKWIIENVRKACDLAVKYGNTHIRAFADVDSKARLEGVKGVIRGREEYKDRLDIQVVAFPQDGVAREPGAKELIKQAMDLLGNVDLFVNCAGISHVGLITEESNEGWSEILDANLSSTFYCSRAIVPYMIREQKGRILNISSVWGNVGASCEVAYSATKGGINAFTKALAKELAPSGIAVNALACGIIDTPMNQCFSRMRSRKSVMRFRPAVWEIRKKSVKWPFFLPRLLFTSPARSSLWMADGSDHLTMVPPPSTYCSS